jgi:hypothetical protein
MNMQTSTGLNLWLIDAKADVFIKPMNNYYYNLFKIHIVSVMYFLPYLFAPLYEYRIV